MWGMGTTASTVMGDTELTEINGCPAERTIRLLEGRWRPMDIHWLLQRTMRFNELQRSLGPITHRTLSRTLKEMESDGLLERRDYGEIPPRVDYRLTPLGRTLEPVLLAMHEWALRQAEAPAAIQT
jgi:DNA-binding HxlR family transcriptional regulator